MCGVAEGDIDDCTGVAAQFRVSARAPNDPLGFGELKTLCITCEEGTTELDVDRLATVGL